MYDAGFVFSVISSKVHMARYGGGLQSVKFELDINTTSSLGPFPFLSRCASSVPFEAHGLGFGPVFFFLSCLKGNRQIPNTLDRNESFFSRALTRSVYSFSKALKKNNPGWVSSIRRCVAQTL